MKRLGMIFAIIALLASAAFAQEGPRALAGAGEKPERPQAQLQNSIADLYLANFKEKSDSAMISFSGCGRWSGGLSKSDFKSPISAGLLEERQAQLLNQSERL